MGSVALNGPMADDRRGGFRGYFCRACGEVARRLMTHNGHRDGFQFAPQQTHGRHSIIRRGSAECSPRDCHVFFILENGH